MKALLKEDLLRSTVRRLARTQFGQKALALPDRQNIRRQKPTTRVYCGLVLMALSYLIGLPALAFLSYLSVRMSQPMIFVIGGPVIFGLYHLMFAVGAYLAGQNYAREALLRVTKHFLRKTLNP